MKERGSVTRSNVEWFENPQIQDAQYPNRDHFLPAFRFRQHALNIGPLKFCRSCANCLFRCRVEEERFAHVKNKRDFLLRRHAFAGRKTGHERMRAALCI